MKKWFLYVISILLLFCPQHGCLELEDTVNVYITNMTAVSDIHVYLEWPYPGIDHDYSCIVGKSSSKTIKVAVGQYDWTVIEINGNEIVGSGTMDFSYNRWLDVDFENGIWSCTWHG